MSISSKPRPGTEEQNFKDGGEGGRNYLIAESELRGIRKLGATLASLSLISNAILSHEYLNLT